MAETGGTARSTGDRREHQANAQAPAAEAARTPGLEAARAVEGNGEPAALQIANLLRRYPGERDEILTWMQQHRGMQFANLVRNHLGTVERMMPEGFELTDVHASISIPGNRKLGGTWQADVSTAYPTNVTARITATGVSVSFSPPMFVNGNGWVGLRNAEIRGAHLDFATGQVHADVDDARGFTGFISIKDTLAQMITHSITKGVANTPLAHPGYSPTHDTNLQASIQSVLHAIQGMVTSEPGKPASTMPVGTKEMTGPSVGGSVVAKLGGSFLQNGNGLVIAPGSSVSVDVQGESNIAELQRSQEGGVDPARGLDAAHVSGVHLSASNLVVQAKGKPVARLLDLTLHPGGAITIDRMEALGAVANARGTESSFAILIALVARSQGDLNTANNAYNYAGNPQVVDSVTRRLIQDELTKSVHELVLANRAAVPGVDLARVLGIH
ncbi:MAG TPA: hypothetical protein VGM90_00820 [Kofleriaceae bacterium]|jgi:hypothetical protein